jgi:hypothetical protein
MTIARMPAYIRMSGCSSTTMIVLMPPRAASKIVSDKFAAFSDPTRLRIFHLLRHGESLGIFSPPRPSQWNGCCSCSHRR